MLVITVAGKPSAAEDLLIPLTNLSEEHVDDAIRTERAGHGRANRRRWIESLVMIQYYIQYLYNYLHIYNISHY